MVRRLWITPHPDLEVVPTPDFDIPPVGQNVLDAYRQGYVAVTLDEGGPVVEGKNTAIQEAAVMVSGAIQDYYGAGLEPDEVMNPEFDAYLQVQVRPYDDRGRPLSGRLVPLRYFVVGQIPVGTFGRPSPGVRAYWRPSGRDVSARRRQSVRVGPHVRIVRGPRAGLAGVVVREGRDEVDLYVFPPYEAQQRIRVPKRDVEHLDVG